jgi:hypothetical protein
MINIRQQGNKRTTYLTGFVIDALAELNDAPKFPQVAYGSICYCIEDSNLYILDGKNEYNIMEIGGDNSHNNDNITKKLDGEISQILTGPTIDPLLSGAMEGDN